MNYKQQDLPRYQLSKLSIHDINLEIGAHQKVIEFYEDYILRKGEDRHTQKRIDIYTDN